MATLSNLSTSTLALKGAGTEYNFLQRFFATKVEADAALADGSWTPTAGKLNGCLTGDQGFLVYNEGTSSLDLADQATRAYIDAQISALIDGSPGTLDTLNELAAAINDNPNYFVDAEAARNANTALINAEAARALAAEAAVQADVDQNEADADAAIAAVQADVDQNEADADAAIAAVQADVDQNEADADAAVAGEQVRALAAEAAIQADVDANEVDRRAVVDIQSNITSVKNAVRGTSIEVGNNIAIHPASGGRVEIEGDLLLDNQTDIIDGAGVTLTSFTNINAYDGRLNTLEADPTTAAAVAAVQADVDQNEADADAAIAAVQADVDQNETDGDAADAALSARLDTLEADPTTATAVAAVQADVDQNEADADAAIALKANIDSPTFTGIPQAPTAGAGTNTTQLATTAYVDAAVATLIDSSPAALDTLNELAAAIGDDANFSTTITNSINAVQADVNQNELDSDTADAALSARLDTLEADPTTATAVAAVQADVDQNESDADAAIAAVQADVDQNESDADAADAALSARLDTLEADPTTAAAVAAVQADVDQNETDGDAADAALGVRIDAVETEIDTARTNIYTALGQTEGATAMGTFTGSTLGDGQTVKALLQQLETATEGETTARTAIAEFASNLTRLKNDLRGTYINVGNNIEIRPAAGGRVEIVGDLYLDNNTAIDGSGVTLTSFANINAYDGRLNTLEADPTTATAVAAVQADVDQNEADADAAIAAVLAGTSIPGPYNNDAAAATGGVAVGAIYKNTNGTIHWRVS